MIDIQKIAKDSYNRLSLWNKMKFQLTYNVYCPIKQKLYDIKQYFCNWKAFHKVLKDFNQFDYISVLIVWKTSLEQLREGLAADMDYVDNKKAVKAIDEAVEILTRFIENKFELKATNDYENISLETINTVEEAKRKAMARFCEIIKGQDDLSSADENFWDKYDGTGIETWWS